MSEVNAPKKEEKKSNKLFLPIVIIMALSLVGNVVLLLTNNSTKTELNTEILELNTKNEEINNLYTESTKVVDLLKIDIEGAEAKLFNNIKFLNILEKNVKILAIEVHEDFIKYIEVENILKNLNFLFFHSGELIIAINNNLK